MNAKKTDRTIPLSEKQQLCLVSLVTERADVVQCKSQDPMLLNRKKKIWDKIEAEFRARNPGCEPRGAQQLKWSWDHIKRRVKQEQAKQKRRRSTTGGGPPPSPPSMTEAMSAAAIIMGHELAMNDEPYDSIGLHPVDEDGDPIASVSIDLQQPSTFSVPAPSISSFTPVPSPSLNPFSYSTTTSTPFTPVPAPSLNPFSYSTTTSTNPFHSNPSSFLSFPHLPSAYLPPTPSPSIVAQHLLKFLLLLPLH
nr:proline-rich receptor-like protein kinase PERK8 isoform X2 [Penaeus vannamei]